MAETLSVTYRSELTIVETATGGYISTADNTITTNGLNESGTLNSGTTPAVTKRAVFQQAMTSGAATIDLTALPGLNADEVVTFLGLRVQIFKIRNLSTNANKITVSNGASNPYRLDGATTTWTIVLAPSQSVEILLENAGDVVASGHKTIDLAGTAAQVLEVGMVAG